MKLLGCLRALIRRNRLVISVMRAVVERVIDACLAVKSAQRNVAARRAHSSGQEDVSVNGAEFEVFRG